MGAISSLVQPVLAELTWLLPTLVGILGLLIGSFLNVVILRYPVILDRRWRAQCADYATTVDPSPPAETFNLVVPRSRCPHCGHAISAVENIPVISFLVLRGRCSACHHAISWRYPIIELATAIASAIVAAHFGWSIHTLPALVLTWTLIALAVIDFDHQLLPDDLTLPLLWTGLLVNILAPFTSLPSAVIGAAAGYVSLWIVYQLFKLLTGKEGMGYGDFKLFAAFGAWLGWERLPLIILFASLVGALVGVAMITWRGRDRHLPIPFGPFLCVAGWIALLWGDSLTRAYLQFARLG